MDIQSWLDATEHGAPPARNEPWTIPLDDLQPTANRRRRSSPEAEASHVHRTKRHVHRPRAETTAEHSPPIAPFEKRPRRKTRADRYEPVRTASSEKERRHKRKRPRLPQAPLDTHMRGLVHDLELKTKVCKSRLTLKPSQPPGILSHGKASKQLHGAATQDAALLRKETRFLQGQALISDAEDSFEKTRQSSKAEKRRAEEDQTIANYFGSTKIPQAPCTQSNHGNEHDLSFAIQQSEHRQSVDAHIPDQPVSISSGLNSCDDRTKSTTKRSSPPINVQNHVTSPHAESFPRQIWQTKKDDSTFDGANGNSPPSQAVYEDHVPSDEHRNPTSVPIQAVSHKTMSLSPGHNSGVVTALPEPGALLYSDDRDSIDALFGAFENALTHPQMDSTFPWSTPDLDCNMATEHASHTEAVDADTFPDSVLDEQAKQMPSSAAPNVNHHAGFCRTSPRHERLYGSLEHQRLSSWNEVPHHQDEADVYTTCDTGHIIDLSFARMLDEGSNDDAESETDTALDDLVSNEPAYHQHFRSVTSSSTQDAPIGFWKPCKLY